MENDLIGWSEFFLAVGRQLQSASTAIPPADPNSNLPLPYTHGNINTTPVPISNRDSYTVTVSYWYNCTYPNCKSDGHDVTNSVPYGKWEAHP